MTEESKINPSEVKKTEDKNLFSIPSLQELIESVGLKKELYQPLLNPKNSDYSFTLFTLFDGLIRETLGSNFEIMLYSYYQEFKHFWIANPTLHASMMHAICMSYSLKSLYDKYYGIISALQNNPELPENDIIKHRIYPLLHQLLREILGNRDLTVINKLESDIFLISSEYKCEIHHHSSTLSEAIKGKINLVRSIELQQEIFRELEIEGIPYVPMLLSGWADPNGHAIMLLYRIIAEDKAIINVINSGAGISQHPVEGVPEGLKRCGIQSEISFSSLWELLQVYFIPHSSHRINSAQSVELFYQKIPQRILLSGEITSITSEKPEAEYQFLDKTIVIKNGDLMATSQKSGTCCYFSILYCITYLATLTGKSVEWDAVYQECIKNNVIRLQENLRDSISTCEQISLIYPLNDIITKHYSESISPFDINEFVFPKLVEYYQSKKCNRVVFDVTKKEIAHQQVSSQAHIIPDWENIDSAINFIWEKIENFRLKRNYFILNLYLQKILNWDATQVNQFKSESVPLLLETIFKIQLRMCNTYFKFWNNPIETTSQQLEAFTGLHVNALNKIMRHSLLNLWIIATRIIEVNGIEEYFHSGMGISEVLKSKLETEEMPTYIQGFNVSNVNLQFFTRMISPLMQPIMEENDATSDSVYLEKKADPEIDLLEYHDMKEIFAASNPVGAFYHDLIFEWEKDLDIYDNNKIWYTQEDKIFQQYLLQKLATNKEGNSLPGSQIYKIEFEESKNAFNIHHSYKGPDLNIVNNLHQFLNLLRYPNHSEKIMGPPFELSYISTAEDTAYQGIVFSKLIYHNLNSILVEFGLANILDFAKNILNYLLLRYPLQKLLIQEGWKDGVVISVETYEKIIKGDVWEEEKKIIEYSKNEKIWKEELFNQYFDTPKDIEAFILEKILDDEGMDNLIQEFKSINPTSDPTSTEVIGKIKEEITRIEETNTELKNKQRMAILFMMQVIEDAQKTEMINWELYQIIQMKKIDRYLNAISQRLELYQKGIEENLKPEEIKGEVFPQNKKNIQFIIQFITQFFTLVETIKVDNDDDVAYLKSLFNNKFYSRISSLSLYHLWGRPNAIINRDINYYVPRLNDNRKWDLYPWKNDFIKYDPSTPDNLIYCLEFLLQDYQNPVFDALYLYKHLPTPPYMSSELDAHNIPDGYHYSWHLATGNEEEKEKLRSLADIPQLLKLLEKVLSKAITHIDVIILVFYFVIIFDVDLSKYLEGISQYLANKESDKRSTFGKYFVTLVRAIILDEYPVYNIRDFKQSTQFINYENVYHSLYYLWLYRVERKNPPSITNTVHQRREYIVIDNQNYNLIDDQERYNIYFNSITQQKIIKINIPHPSSDASSLIYPLTKDNLIEGKYQIFNYSGKNNFLMDLFILLSNGNIGSGSGDNFINNGDNILIDIHGNALHLNEHTHEYTINQIPIYHPDKNIKLQNEKIVKLPERLLPWSVLPGVFITTHNQLYVIPQSKSNNLETIFVELEEKSNSKNKSIPSFSDWELHPFLVEFDNYELNINLNEIDKLIYLYLIVQQKGIFTLTTLLYKKIIYLLQLDKMRKYSTLLLDLQSNCNSYLKFNPLHFDSPSVIKSLSHVTSSAGESIIDTGKKLFQFIANWESYPVLVPADVIEDIDVPEIACPGSKGDCSQLEKVTCLSEFKADYWTHLSSKLVNYKIDTDKLEQFLRLYDINELHIQLHSDLEQFHRNIFPMLQNTWCWQDIIIQQAPLLHSILCQQKILSTLVRLHQLQSRAEKLTDSQFVAEYQEIYLYPEEYLFDHLEYQWLSEILTGKIFRKDQVEFTRRILAEVETQPNIYELLMGRGKTSVITPLLALQKIINNKNVWITLPTHLVKQSTNIIGNCMSLLNIAYFHVYPGLKDISVWKRIRFAAWNMNLKDVNNLIEHKIVITSDVEFKRLALQNDNLNKISNDFYHIFDEFDHMYQPNSSEYNINFQQPVEIAKQKILFQWVDQLVIYYYSQYGDDLDNVSPEDAQKVYHDFCEMQSVKMAMETSWIQAIDIFLRKSEIKTQPEARVIQYIGYLQFIEKYFIQACLMMANKDYGKSQSLNPTTDKQKYLAIPYIAVNQPAEGSFFTNPYLSLILTVLTYHRQSITWDSFYPIYVNVRNKTWEMKKIIKEKLIIESINWLHTYFPQEMIDDDSINRLQIQFQKIKSQSQFISLILQNYILPKFINYNDIQKNISFMDLLDTRFTSQKTGFSGSVEINLPQYPALPDYQNYTFHNIIEDDASRSNVFAALLGIVHPIQIYHTEVITLEHITATMIESQSTVLIDAGAYLKNYSSLRVAQELMLVLKKPVIYLDNNSNKFIWNGTTSVSYNNQVVTSENYGIYYDHKHTIGVDIKQDVGLVGLLTLNSFNRLTDISQGAFRLRKLNQSHVINYLWEVNKLPELHTPIQIVKHLICQEESYKDSSLKNYYLQNLRCAVRKCMKHVASQYDKYPYVENRNTLEEWDLDKLESQYYQEKYCQADLYLSEMECRDESITSYIYQTCQKLSDRYLIPQEVTIETVVDEEQEMEQEQEQEQQIEQQREMEMAQVDEISTNKIKFDLQEKEITLSQLLNPHGVIDEDKLEWLGNTLNFEATESPIGMRVIKLHQFLQSQNIFVTAPVFYNLHSSPKKSHHFSQYVIIGRLERSQLIPDEWLYKNTIFNIYYTLHNQETESYTLVSWLEINKILASLILKEDKTCFYGEGYPISIFNCHGINILTQEPLPQPIMAITKTFISQTPFNIWSAHLLAHYSPDIIQPFYHYEIRSFINLLGYEKYPYSDKKKEELTLDDLGWYLRQVDSMYHNFYLLLLATFLFPESETHQVEFIHKLDKEFPIINDSISDSIHHQIDLLLTAIQQKEEKIDEVEDETEDIKEENTEDTSDADIRALIADMKRRMAALQEIDTELDALKN